MMPMSYFEGKGEEIVIKVPRYSVYSDYDYIGFTFNGKHACEDLGIYRVSSSNRYQEELNPERKERTAEAPGADYVYYLGETFGPRKFKVDFAFEGLSQRKVNAIRDCFDDMDIHELWFDEYPYKVYEAKVQGPVTLKVIPFGNSNEEPTYSGEGSVTFVCYTPYARTPDWVEVNGMKLDGKQISSYMAAGFKNIDQWRQGSGLDGDVSQMPHNFLATLVGTQTIESNNFSTYEDSTFKYEFIPEASGYYIVKYNGDLSAELNSITIPESVNGFQVIGIREDVFNNLDAIKDYINNPGKESGKGNQYYTGNQEVTIGSWLIKFPKWWSSDYKVGDKIKGIADRAFWESTVSSIDLNRIKYLGEKAFNSCDILSSFSIPSTVIYMGYAPFSMSTKIKILESDNNIYQIENGCIVNTYTKTLIQASKATVLSRLCDMDIKEIGKEAVRYIGRDDNNNKIELKLPNTLIKIGESAFRQTLFTSVKIPSSVRFIDDYSFQQMDHLGSITIDKDSNLQSIGKLAFSHNKDNSRLTTFSFTNLPYLKTLGEDAFAYTKITELDLTTAISLKTIGRRAFAVSGIERITLPEKLTEIGEFCFIYTADLKSITIPASVITIYHHAFQNSGITEITFNNSEGWYKIHKDGSPKQEVSSDDLTATNFKGTYLNYNLVNETIADQLECYVYSYSSSGELQKEKKIRLLAEDAKQYTKITWNSATGLVVGEKDGVKKVLHIQGDSAGELPPGIIDTINIQELKYHYWYY